MMQLLETDNRVVRVIGAPVQQAGLLIEVTMDTDDLRMSMIDYGVRILALSDHPGAFKMSPGGREHEYAIFRTPTIVVERGDAELWQDGPGAR